MSRLICILAFVLLLGPELRAQSTSDLSKEELAYKIREQIPSFDIEFDDFKEDPDKRNYIVSSDKLKDTGFEATRTIEAGVRELIQGFKIITAQRNPYGNI